MGPIVVHHLNQSRSQRILWLLEELELPYEVKHYQRDPQTMLAPASLQAVHPLGKSPVLTDGAITVAESGAIIEYILDQYGQGRLVPPAGTADKRAWQYWLHFAEGSAMPPLLLKLVFDKVASAPPFFVRPITKQISAKVQGLIVTPNLQKQYDYIQKTLSESPWFAGSEFTAADIQMSYPLEAAEAGGLLEGPSRSKIKDWIQRIHARPAFQRAIEKGGPYDLMFRR